MLFRAVFVFVVAVVGVVRYTFHMSGLVFHNFSFFPRNLVTSLLVFLHSLSLLVLLAISYVLSLSVPFLPRASQWNIDSIHPVKLGQFVYKALFLDDTRIALFVNTFLSLLS